jgi:hypothetical protein
MTKPLNIQPKSGKSNSKVLQFLLDLNRLFFAPLTVAAFATVIIDTGTYSGYVAKVMSAPAMAFMVLTVISYVVLFLERIFFNANLNEESKLALRINIIALPFLLFLYQVFSQLEVTHFPNYVFSNFHFHLFLLQRIIMFSLFLSLLYIVDRFPQIKLFTFLKKQKVATSLELKTIAPVIFGLALLLLVITQLYATFSALGADAIAILRHPFASWEQRRSEKFGRPYGTFNFINSHTPANATIAAPPQNRWGIEGNIGFSRYFIYPRFLLHPEDFTPSTLPHVDYFLIAQTELDATTGKYRTWPEFPLEGEQIFLYNEFTQKEESTSVTNYTPNDPLFRGKWGLIKLKTQPHIPEPPEPTKAP